MSSLCFEYSLADIKQAAYKIIRFANTSKIWVFDGSMGAGKTTLIKQICLNLEVTDTVNSPTFSIVNEYSTIHSETIYHFDFYRLKHEVEALDIGADEYFNSGFLCLIEWAEKIPSLLPEEIVEVSILAISDTVRSVVVRKTK